MRNREETVRYLILAQSLGILTACRGAGPTSDINAILEYNFAGHNCLTDGLAMSREL